MSRQKGKAIFIGLEVLKSSEKYAARLGKSETAVESIPLLIEQAANIERIKHISSTVPAKCFKKDGSGIDRRRYRRHLRKNSGVVAGLNIQAQSSNQAAIDNGRG